MKFWVHCPLELYKNTIWKFLKFSSELALSLFLTHCFFLIVQVLLFMQGLAFPYKSAHPWLAVYVNDKSSEKLIGGSVCKFQWWNSSTGKFYFGGGQGRGGEATSLSLGLPIRLWRVLLWGLGFLQRSIFWSPTWEVNVLGSSGWSEGSRLTPLF